MGLYTPVAGQTLTGSFLNSALLNITPGFAIKLGDTSRNTTTTLTNDPDLSIPAAANLTYVLFAGLYYDTGATPQIKFDLNIPGAGTRNQLLGGLDTSVTASTSGIMRMARNVQNLGNATSGTTVGALYSAEVTMAGTSGNIVMQWAQNVSNATATILKAGSWMLLIQDPQ